MQLERENKHRLLRERTAGLELEASEHRSVYRQPLKSQPEEVAQTNYELQLMELEKQNKARLLAMRTTATAGGNDV